MLARPRTDLFVAGLTLAHSRAMVDVKIVSATVGHGWRSGNSERNGEPIPTTGQLGGPPPLKRQKIPSDSETTTSRCQSERSVLLRHSGQEGRQPIIQTMCYFIDLRIVKLCK